MFQDKYEFYKPIDCVGFCYLGETSSLRVQRKPVNQLTVGYKNNTFKDVRPTRDEGRYKVKRKKCEYGTIALKVRFFSMVVDRWL